MSAFDEALSALVAAASAELGLSISRGDVAALISDGLAELQPDDPSVAEAADKLMMRVARVASEWQGAEFEATLPIVENAIRPRAEIEADPRRIDRAQIRRGDVIESWTASTGIPGQLKLFARSVADRNDRDLARRWTCPKGFLVHSGHGGCEDASPTSDDFEVLLRVGRDESVFKVSA